MNKIVPMKIDVTDKATELLFTCLKDDPISQFILLKKNDTVLKNYFKSLVKMSIICGNAYITQDFKGVSLWLKPNVVIPLKGVICSGILISLFRFGIQGFGRIQKISQAGLEIKKNKVIEPCWHLLAIGVNDVDRRNGVGRDLMRHVFIEADRRRQACYLETANIKSKVFFENSGFKVIQEVEIEENGLKIFGMMRTR